MKRVSELIKEYNIGLDTLRDFLRSKGFKTPLRISTKISSEIEALISTEYIQDKIAKEKKQKIDITTSYDKLYTSIWKMKKDETRRIPISAGMTQINYDNLFGVCFSGCNEVNLIDPYIRLQYSFDNLYRLIRLIQTESMNKILLKVTTCFDKINTKRMIEMRFKNLINGVVDEELEIRYEILSSKELHDRKIKVDNRFLIDLTRGLDIFQKPSSNFTSYRPVTKEATIFITKLT